MIYYLNKIKYLYKNIKNTNAQWVVLADSFALFIGIVNGFFLPKVFSIEGYALFKTFSLYAVYAAFFSFGLSDGLYIIYGGKKEEEINPSELKAYYIFLIKLQTAVFAVLFFISVLVLKDKALIFFAFFVFPLQLIHFFRLYFRATGSLEHYSKAQGFIVLLELIDAVLIVWVLKTRQPDLFITIKIINHFILAAVLLFYLFKKTENVKAAKLKLSKYFSLMKTGIYVLAADSVAALIFAVDRWFIMLHFDSRTFAFYAFAVSIMNIFLRMILSVMYILYSYMSKTADDLNIRFKIRKIVFYASCLLPFSYFIVKPVITGFLPVYESSLKVLWILMMALPMISMVNIFFINVYKSTGRVKYYLKKMLVILSVGIFLNFAAVYIFGEPEAVAWATLLTYVIWLLYSLPDSRLISQGALKQ